jgi:hypothetical protein
MMRCSVLLACATLGLSAAGQPPMVTFKARTVSPFQIGLDFSPDGKFVATCGDKVRVFEAKSGNFEREFEGVRTRAVVFSPVSKELLAAGAEDGVIRFHAVGKAGVVRELKGTEGGVYSLAFDPSGKLLASGSERFQNDAKKITAFGQFRLWEVETGKLLKSIDVKDGGAKGVSFSDDGKFVAFCANGAVVGGTATLEVYRVEPWESVASVKLTADGLVGKPFGIVPRFLPDGKRLLVGGGVCEPVNPAEGAPFDSGCHTNGLLWAVELGDKPAAKLLDGPRRGYYGCVSLSPDGKRYVTNGVIDPANGSSRIEVRETDGGKVVWFAPSGSDALGVKFTPDGKFVSAIGTDHDVVRLFDAANGTLVRAITAEK